MITRARVPRCTGNDCQACRHTPCSRQVARIRQSAGREEIVAEAQLAYTSRRELQRSATRKRGSRSPLLSTRIAPPGELLSWLREAQDRNQPQRTQKAAGSRPRSQNRRAMPSPQRRNNQPPPPELHGAGAGIATAAPSARSALHRGRRRRLTPTIEDGRAADTSRRARLANDGAQQAAEASTR